MSGIKIFLTILFQILLIIAPYVLLHLWHPTRGEGNLIFLMHSCAMFILFILTWLIIIIQVFYYKI